MRSATGALPGAGTPGPVGSWRGPGARGPDSPGAPDRGSGRGGVSPRAPGRRGERLRSRASAPSGRALAPRAEPGVAPATHPSKAARFLGSRAGITLAFVRVRGKRACSARSRGVETRRNPVSPTLTRRGHRCDFTLQKPRPEPRGPRQPPPP